MKFISVAWIPRTDPCAKLLQLLQNTAITQHRNQHTQSHQLELGQSTRSSDGISLLGGVSPCSASVSYLRLT